jgi:galactofuranosylgalactofuranosylrhamnosyl-N-acetylglucosaminyl-diphospho-decaprenol beta-1,5/1,6-galactofuranosyltransferase
MTAVDDRPATLVARPGGSAPTVGLDVVARVVLPVAKDPDVLPLYVDGAHVPEPLAGGVPTLTLPSDQRPDQVLGRRSYRLDPGGRTSFATYLNAFPAAYWRRFTPVREVTLTVRTTGPGTLVVYRSSARGAVARVTSRRLEKVTSTDVVLPLDGFVDGGWLWFDLVAAADELVLDEAEWAVAGAGSTCEDLPGITVGITTFNRPGFCTALLAQLGGARELDDLVEEVLVVDQGTQRVADDPGFDAARAGLGGRLRVLRQPNLGGSGGFSRAMLETLDAGRSDHVLLLDDDVVAEPEGIARAVAFARHASRPTVVGGHMFSLHERSVLHAFSEVVTAWQFRWSPAAPSVHDHDLARWNLRSTPWMHRRIHADYTGWWMCLVPTEVLRDVGLSMPFFLKWDDAEFGLRAGAAGHPTVSLPGAPIWHVPWTDKDDDVDWQSYFHARNRIVAALLHSRYDRGGRLVRESLAISVKHVMAMQYSAAALRLRAVQDVLAGPGGLHEALGTRLGDVRSLRADHVDAQVRPDADDFGPVRPSRPRRRDRATERPTTRRATLRAAATGVVHQVLPVGPGAAVGPEREVASPDAGWWTLAALDSALVATADGTGLAWLRRDRGTARRALADALRVHRELLRRWPELAATYRRAVPEMVGEDAWRRTLGLGDPASTPDRHLRTGGGDG